MGYPSYYRIARVELGLREISGPGSNPRIMAMAARVAKVPGREWVKTFYKDDGIPWCALGVSDSLVQAGLPIPLNPLSAGAFRDYGENLDGPMAGAIAVKSRKGGNHVGLVSGISPDGKRLLVLGFNQGDACSESWYPTKAFDSFRAPGGVKLDAAPKIDPTPVAQTPTKES